MGGRGQGLCDDSIKPYYKKNRHKGQEDKKNFKLPDVIYGRPFNSFFYSSQNLFYPNL